jgi:SNF2 family DNA or RNA helicase
LTRGKGEPDAKTAADLLRFLCHGCPTARLVLQEILTHKILEEVNKEIYGHHQKLVISEKVPANALYLSLLLRAGLIDTRVIHAGLSNGARSQLVKLFNDPNSSLKVLIMMFNVSAVGLNLEKAYDRVVIVSIPRNRSQDAQLGRRVDRVSCIH